MKNECNIARDLMPLCIDGVASEESKKYVDDHIAECTECAVTYGEMRVELPRINAEKEKAAMEQAAQEVNRKRRNRKRLLIALTSLVTALVFIAGCLVYDYASVRSEVPVALDAYDAYLSRTREGGEVILNIDMKDDSLVFGVSGHAEETESGGWIWRTAPHTPLIRHYTNHPQKGLWTDPFDHWYWIDGVIYSGNPANNEPLEKVILTCGKEEKVIYQTGDEIPFCSEEMEAYFKAADEAYDYAHSSANRRSFDFAEKNAALWDKANELRKLVPEWQ